MHHHIENVPKKMSNCQISWKKESFQDSEYSKNLLFCQPNS